MQNIDPKIFGIHPSTKIVQKKKNEYEIIINRKTRVIMKDGKNILQKIAKIQEAQPGAKVSIRLSSPICSKTKAFLESKNINIVQDKKK